MNRRCSWSVHPSRRVGTATDEDDVRAMTVRDPATAPRERESGYKGDAWSVTLPVSPPDSNEMMLILDTGLDSVAIVRVPNAWWDRSERPSAVRVHDGYDE